VEAVSWKENAEVFNRERKKTEGEVTDGYAIRGTMASFPFSFSNRFFHGRRCCPADVPFRERSRMGRNSCQRDALPHKIGH